MTMFLFFDDRTNMWISSQVKITHIHSKNKNNIDIKNHNAVEPLIKNVYIIGFEQKM